MADITPLIRSDRMVIQGYSAGQFKISGKIYEEPVLVFPDQVVAWPVTPDPDDLSVEHFSQLTAQAKDIDVVLLGTGTHSVFIPSAFKRKLKEQGLVLEFMDTGAACRTYNVLLAEGRRVVAALIPVTADK